jgi:hypothetical protein
MLLQQVVTPGPATPQESVALSRLNLTRIKATAQAKLAVKGLDDDTNAHLMDTVARIDRALNANRQTVTNRSPQASGLHKTSGR